MDPTNVLAFLLARGNGTRIHRLTAEHGKPALPSPPVTGSSISCSATWPTRASLRSTYRRNTNRDPSSNMSAPGGHLGGTGSVSSKSYFPKQTAAPCSATSSRANSRNHWAPRATSWAISPAPIGTERPVRTVSDSALPALERNLRIAAISAGAITLSARQECSP